MIAWTSPGTPHASPPVRPLSSCAQNPTRSGGVVHARQLLRRMAAVNGCGSLRRPSVHAKTQRTSSPEGSDVDVRVIPEVGDDVGRRTAPVAARGGHGHFARRRRRGQLHPAATSAEMRMPQLALIVAGGVAGALTLVDAMYPPWLTSYRPRETLDYSLVIAAVGAVHASVGIVAWRQRPASRVGPLMLAVGLAWLVFPLIWVPGEITWAIATLTVNIPPVRRHTDGSYGRDVSDRAKRSRNKLVRWRGRRCSSRHRRRGGGQVPRLTVTPSAPAPAQTSERPGKSGG